MKTILILLAIVILLISTVSGSSPPKAKEVREKHEAELFEIKGVSGVSVDETNNEIIVYIEKAEISKKVPKKLGGISVRHEVTGRINALQATTCILEPITIDKTDYSRTERIRPDVFGGISVGNPFTSAGTLGLVTNDNYILSNAHILALDNNARFLHKGTPILQPGPYDGGASDDAIGVLYKYIKIKFNRLKANNFADAAIATLNPDLSVHNGYVLNEKNNDLYLISGSTNDVTSGDTVRKSGRTSGVTTGTVSSTTGSVKVYYTNRKWAIFKDQIIVDKPFTQPGDSGSAVDKDGKFVGLVFAGSENIAVVCKAKYIIDGLRISI